MLSLPGAYAEQGCHKNMSALLMYNNLVEQCSGIAQRCVHIACDILQGLTLILKSREWVLLSSVEVDR